MIWWLLLAVYAVCAGLAWAFLAGGNRSLHEAADSVSHLFDGGR